VTFPLIDASGIDAGCEPDTAGWRRGPAGWPDGSAVPLGSNAGPVFVGRSRELDLMAGLLADAAAGRPRIVLVEGEAGLGKSSLIAEFLARQREVPVLAASGAAVGDGPPARAPGGRRPAA